MKFYLSSYGLGNKTNKLKKMISKSNKKIAFVPNALDFSFDLERRKKSCDEQLEVLKKLGFEPKEIDLRKYFGKKTELEKEIKKYGAVFVRGGNVFVLRQAMKKSGFDNILTKLFNSKKDFLYAGYSAGVCILAPSINELKLVDDINQKPYGKKQKVILNGLGFLNYLIVPHYKSNHNESEQINKVVDYCIENKILFKTLKDGEVIVID